MLLQSTTMLVTPYPGGSNTSHPLLNGSTLDPDDQYPYDDITRIVDILTLTIMIILGLFGNCLIIAAIGTSKSLRSPCDMFVLNMVIADFFVNLVFFPMLGSIIAQQNVLNHFLCQVSGITIITGCIASVLSLTMIALTRMVHICNTFAYNVYFTRKHCSWYCTILWVVSILMGIPPVLGWGAVGYWSKAAHCGLLYRESLSYDLFVYIIVEGTALTVTFTCYGRIFIKIKSSAKQLTQHVTNQAKEQKQRMKARQRQAFCSFVISAMFTILWSPFCVSTVWDVNGEVPSTVIKIATWMGFSNSAVNGIVYVGINKHYRNACMRCLPCLSRRVEPEYRLNTVTGTEGRGKKSEDMHTKATNVHIINNGT